MTAINPNFKGTYVMPKAELQKKDDKDLKEIGEQTAKLVLQGGKIMQTDNDVVVTVPFEKEQEYEAILAKYNIQANKTN